MKATNKFEIDLHINNLKSAIKQIDKNLNGLILNKINEQPSLFKKIALEIQDKMQNIKEETPDNEAPPTEQEIDTENTKMACLLLLNLMINRELIVKEDAPILKEDKKLFDNHIDYLIAQAILG